MVAWFMECRLAFERQQLRRPCNNHGIEAAQQGPKRATACPLLLRSQADEKSSTEADLRVGERE
jgi:hypothetical protein